VNDVIDGVNRLLPRQVDLDHLSQASALQCRCRI